MVLCVLFLRGRLFPVGSACWWGRLVRVVGPDVSKTEGIKASVAWGLFKKPCDCLVFSVSRCMTLGLISSVLDTWRGQCAVPAPEQGCRRGGPGHSKALEHRGERGGAPPTRFRGRSREPGISSSGMKPALRAAAPLTARTLAPSGQEKSPPTLASDRLVTDAGPNRVPRPVHPIRQTEKALQLCTQHRIRSSPPWVLHLLGTYRPTSTAPSAVPAPGLPHPAFLPYLRYPSHRPYRPHPPGPSIAKRPTAADAELPFARSCGPSEASQALSQSPQRDWRRRSSPCSSSVSSSCCRGPSPCGFFTFP